MSDLVDLDVISDLRASLGDDAVRSFAQRMLAEMGDLSPKLTALLADDDLPSLVQVAHKAAGSAAALGARSLQATLKSIEGAARANDAGSGAQYVAALAGQVDMTAEFFASILAQD
ncbi:MAG: hypothetical protein EBU97_04920 [Rhodobacteraceae bacterium]|nr:hypothetical protein [Paracoccaceae bacterium]